MQKKTKNTSESKIQKYHEHLPRINEIHLIKQQSIIPVKNVYNKSLAISMKPSVSQSLMKSTNKAQRNYKKEDELHQNHKPGVHTLDQFEEAI